MALQDQVIMEDVQIIFKNFAGREGMYNQEGDRNFNVIIDAETAEAMRADGWNIKTIDPREEGDEPTYTLPVSVKYIKRDGTRVVYPPRVVMIGSKNRTELDDETIDILDAMEFKTVDLIVRPSRWSVQGKSGVKAYLASMYVTIVEDPLALKYAESE